MLTISKILVDCFKSGHFVYICGNGGSAAQAQHMAAEFMGKFEMERKPLPAIALTTDTSFLTAWTNDNENGTQTIFSRQIEALGKPGDVLVAISTSGKSKNVLEAIETAHSHQMIVVDFPKCRGKTSTIQEYQLKLMHQICREVEQKIYGQN